MQQEHPFAQYVRILGKGKNGSRALTQDEAYDAMKMIMANQVSPEQLGAFLMLMRVKEENAEELTGFVQAVRESFKIPKDHPNVQLDWSSYAGKRRQLPWFLLSTLVLAENGIKVFMHGASGHTAGRVYTKDVAPVIGLALAGPYIGSTVKSIRRPLFDAGHFSPRLSTYSPGSGIDVESTAHVGGQG